MLSQNDQIIQRSLCLILLILLCTSVLVADSKEKPNFLSVGATRQYHKESSKVGVGTCDLISPKWALTAWHVAKHKSVYPDGGKLECVFRGSVVTRQVTKVYKAPGVDVALLRLNRRVEANEGVPYLALNADKILGTGVDGYIDFTMVGRSGGLHYHRNRRGYGVQNGTSFFHLKKNGSRPGKAGDSGGAYLIERYCDYSHVLFSVIHGGGYGPQVAPLKSWINNLLATTGDEATWVSKSKWKKWDTNDVGTPYPYKATWSKKPDSGPNGNITMKATSACDESGVEYFFTCLEDSSHDSGWQASNSYTDTNCVIGERYTYTVTVRDTSKNHNMTEPSTNASAISGMSNLSFELPALSSGASQSGIEGWFNSTATLTRDEGHGEYPLTPNGQNWAQMNQGTWMYQQFGKFQPNTNYHVAFLAGQRTGVDSDYTNSYVSLLAGGDASLAEDGLDVLYHDGNPLETIVGASIVDISDAISPFPAPGLDTQKISLVLSSETGFDPNDPLWIQIHNDNVLGKTLVDNVSIREILMLADEPEYTSVDLGATAEFSLTSIGVDSFAWYKGDPNGVILLSDGGDIFNTTTDTLSIANVETADEGNYFCILTGSKGTETSASAQLSTNPMVISDPVETTVDLGDTAEFTVVSNVATGFAWYRYKDDVTDLLEDDGDISGTTTATLSIANVETADEGFYYCVLTFGNDSEQSLSAELMTNPIVATDPESVLTTLGAAAQFVVEASVPADFAWYKSGDPNVLLTDGNDISGAATATLTIKNISASDEGSYYCVLTYGNDSEASGLAYLTTASLVAVDPTNVKGYEGKEAEITVVSPLADQFQWYKEDADGDIMLVDGEKYIDANTPTLTIYDLGADDEGKYYCSVSSTAFGVSNTSKSATLTVKRLLALFKFEQNLDDYISGYKGVCYNTNNDIATNPLEFVNEPNSMVDDYAQKFLGNEKYIKIKSSNSMNFFKYGFTFSAWYRVKPEESGTGYYTVIAKQNTSQPYKGFHIAALANTLRIQMRDSNGDAQKVTYSAGTHDGQWHLLTATCDTDNVKLYLDGKFVGNKYIGNKTIANLTSEPIVIGALNDNGAQNFKGLIDEVRMYDYAIDHDQIIQMYLNENPYGNNVCTHDPISDRDGDCFVDIADFAKLAAEALDLEALAVMATEWLDDSNIVVPETEIE